MDTPVTVNDTCECGEPPHVRKTGECQRCYSRRYYREHRVAGAEPRKPLTDQERRERNRLRSRSYYAANRDRLIAQTAAWKVAHPDEVRAQHARYRAAHPDRNKGGPDLETRVRQRAGLWLPGSGW